MKLTLPKNMVKWDTRFVHVYALDRNTIGISMELIDEWTDYAFKKTEVRVERENGKWTIEIPESFRDFYHIYEREDVTMSWLTGIILLTVKTNKKK